MMQRNKAIATLTRRRDYLDRCIAEDGESPAAIYDRAERAALDRAIESLKKEGEARR